MVVGLGVRLAFGLGYWVDKPLTHDENEYLTLARSLATGQGFRYPPPSGSEPEPNRYGRAPGYPAFVALVGGNAVASGRPDSSPRSIKVAQSVVGAIGVLVIAVLAWRLAGPTAGATAAAMAAVYPPLVWICGYVLSETLYSALALLTVLVLSLVTDRTESAGAQRSAWVVFGAGVLGGAATLTRPAMLVFLAFAGGWLALRHSWRLAGVWALGSLLVVTPWTIRNVQEYDRVLLVASEGGITFWTGNHPLAIGEGDMAANPEIKRANQEWLARHPGLTPEQLEPIYYREAISHIVAHPVRWLGLLARKFFFLWVPIGPSYTLHSALYLWASVLSYGVVLPFAVAGVIWVGRAKRAPTSLSLMAASVIVTSLVFFPQERFRIPVLDPTFIVFAAAWVAARTGWADAGDLFTA